MSCCPTCGRKIPTVKPPDAPTADLTDDRLFAYYKKSAPAGDLAFWLLHGSMSDPLRDQFKALEPLATGNRAEFYRQLSTLQGIWRRETSALWRHQR